MTEYKSRCLGKSRSAISGDITLSLERGACKWNIISLALMGASFWSAYSHWEEATKLSNYLKNSGLNENRDILSKVIFNDGSAGPIGANQTGYLTKAINELTPSSGSPNPYTSTDYIEDAMNELQKSTDSRITNLASKLKDTVNEIAQYSANPGYLREIATSGDLAQIDQNTSKLFTDYSNQIGSIEGSIDTDWLVSIGSTIFGSILGVLFGYHKHNREPHSADDKEIKS